MKLEKAKIHFKMPIQKKIHKKSIHKREYFTCIASTYHVRNIFNNSNNRLNCLKKLTNIIVVNLNAIKPKGKDKSCDQLKLCFVK